MSEAPPETRRGFRAWIERNGRWAIGLIFPLIALHNVIRYYRFAEDGNGRMAALTLTYAIAMGIFALAWPLLIYCEMRLRARRAK